jgi:excisionase family DNA binding protein
MADVLLSIDEAAKQLQLSKDQVAELVKKGLLRGFLDQKTYKFRPSEIDAYKKKLAGGATVLAEGAPGKIDLTEVDSDVGTEDTDQTSVLAPVQPGEPKDKQPEKPVFQFGEKDLVSDEVSSSDDMKAAPGGGAAKTGDASTDKVVTDILGPAPEDSSDEALASLDVEQEVQTQGVTGAEADLKALHEEEPPPLEEGDQTSLLLPGAGKEEKGKPAAAPAFDFTEKDLKLPSDGERGDSVLIADESESSMDILEVAEESSSESGSSASRIQFSDEITSGDEIEVASESPSQLGQKPAPKATDPSTDKIVADILGPAPDDSSDEALETLDVDEVLETKEVVGAGAGVKPGTGVAAPAADDHDTVGIPTAEETKGTPGAEETKAALGEEGEAAETSGVDGAVAAALQEQATEEEPEEEAAPTIVPAGWETAESWPIGNVLLIAATVALIIAGTLLFCDAFNLHNALTARIAEAMHSQSR